MQRLDEIIKYTSSLKLLLVEDDDATRDASILLLENFFDSIVTAVDGEDGLVKFKDNEIDLIITDISMPKTDGLDMIHMIKKIDNEVPIIVLSSHMEPSYFIRSIKLCVKDYLLKPIDMEYLLDTLERIVLNLKLSEEKLNNKELKYRMEQAILGNNDGIWDWNIAKNCVSFSPRWKEMIGYTEDEISCTYASWEDRVHPDDLEASLSAIQENVDGKTQYYENVHRLKHKDGHWVWILDRGKTLFDEDGKAVRMIGTHTDITSTKEMEIKLNEQKDMLEHLAHHDFLTGLANRVLFDDRLNQAVTRAKRTNTKIALFFIDLNKFKQINDTLGHKAGDGVLKTVSNLMKQTMRENDSIARIGGDEFTVIMEDIIEIKDSLVVAQKLLSTMEEPLAYENQLLSISASIGISIYPDDTKDAATLLKYSDIAMYKSKGSGEKIVYYNENSMRPLTL